LQQAEALPAKIRPHMLNQEFSNVLDLIVGLANHANAYIDSEAPWSLAKTDSARMELVLYVLLEVIRYLAILLLPFIPNAAESMLAQLGLVQDQHSLSCLSRKYALNINTILNKPSIIFKKYIVD
jgi:methionyl-tRNA synthetase